MRALVTGATGFVGRRLLERLDHPVVLSRDPQAASRRLPSAEVFGWQGADANVPPEAVEKVDAVVHLAGEPVGEGRWTAAKKRRIRDSRVLGTRRLVDACQAAAKRPAVLVSASAVGYYGSRADEVLTEHASPGHDFLADVCVEWEREAARACELGMRVVSLRLGIVLGPRGGALAKMLPLFRLGLGGRLGSGRQWMPWVHVDDVVGLFLHAVADPSLTGAVNAVAPEPCTNREFTSALAAVLKRPAFLPAPALALRLAVGEFAEVLLASQRVGAAKALQSGYTFAYPRLRGALEAAIDHRATGGRAAQSAERA